MITKVVCTPNSSSYFQVQLSKHFLTNQNRTRQYINIIYVIYKKEKYEKKKILVKRWQANCNNHKINLDS